MDTPALALIAARSLSLRYSLLALLARLPQIDSVQSVEEAGSMLAALAAIYPALVVLDVDLLGDETGPVLRQIKTIAPSARTVSMPWNVTPFTLYVVPSNVISAQAAGSPARQRGAAVRGHGDGKGRPASPWPGLGA